MREVCEPRTLSKNPSRCSRRQRDPSDPWMIIDRTAIPRFPTFIVPLLPRSKVP